MKKKILVVVDMQKDFIDGALGTREAQAIVPTAAKRVREARAAGEALIATLDTHGPDYMQTSEGRHLPVPHCIRGEAGWELNAEIAAALVKPPARLVDQAGRVEFPRDLRHLTRVKLSPAFIEKNPGCNTGEGI